MAVSDGDTDQVAVERFVTAVRDAGVTLIGLNFAAGDMPGGERGLLSLPGRSADFLASVDIAVGIGAELGTASFNALCGNRVDEVSSHEQGDLVAENPVAAAAAAARASANVLLCRARSFW